MKRILLGTLAIASLAVAAELPAQAYKPVSIGIAAGAAIPVGDLADLENTGFNGTVALGLSSVGSPVGLRFEGMYNKFFGRDDVFPNQNDRRVIAGTGNLVYSLPGSGIRPYLIGGAGYYGLKQDVENAPSENKFGLNGGIGAMFPLSGFQTYAEARFHHVFTEGRSTQFVPVTFGILF